jgi:hypothetical protein
MAATSWVRSHRCASNPPHICIITETYPPEVNGVAFTRAHLVEGLSARGHDLSIVGHVLDRGVDSALYSPERRCPELRCRWGLTETGLAVLHVKWVAPEKNLQLAVQAYRALQRCSAAVKFIMSGATIRSSASRNRQFTLMSYCFDISHPQ